LEIDLHEYTIDGSEGYSRLCSAEWVDAGDGFPGGYFFTGEEQSDGLQIAIDAQGRVTELPWIGLYAHENQISVPGFPGHVVVLNFDDNGGSGVGRDGARSELYMYAASSTQQVLSGEGQLYVFAADDSDLFPNDLSVNVGIPGHWVPVPADIPGDFVALEAFNDDAEVLAFPFIRLEDGFYDKRPGVGPSAYFFDTGRGSIRDVGGDVVDLWGSIYRLDFEDPNDPAGGTATLVLLGRSDGPATGWASPDNGDMDSSGRIMLQEDPAVSPWEPAAGVRPPAIFQLQLAADGTLVDPVGTKVAEVAGGDCSPGADNCWETSGIVDASQWFGDNTWIFDVQAHDEPVANCPDCVEAGQLLLMEID
jgi:secreted PhoX family phosphatase